MNDTIINTVPCVNSCKLDKNNKNKKNEGRCRDIKTPKGCEQGWEASIGPKIKQIISI